MSMKKVASPPFNPPQLPELSLAGLSFPIPPVLPCPLGGRTEWERLVGDETYDDHVRSSLVYMRNKREQERQRLERDVALEAAFPSKTFIGSEKTAPVGYEPLPEQVPGVMGVVMATSEPGDVVSFEPRTRGRIEIEGVFDSDGVVHMYPPGYKISGPPPGPTMPPDEPSDELQPVTADWLAAKFPPGSMWINLHKEFRRIRRVEHYCVEWDDGSDGALDGKAQHFGNHCRAGVRASFGDEVLVNLAELHVAVDPALEARQRLAHARSMRPAEVTPEEWECLLSEAYERHLSPFRRGVVRAALLLTVFDEWKGAMGNWELSGLGHILLLALRDRVKPQPKPLMPVGILPPRRGR